MRSQNLVFTALLALLPALAPAFQPLFDTWMTYDVGDSPWAVTTSDLDNDGDIDLAVVNRDFSVSVVLNFGDGTFGPQTLYTPGGFSICAADLDGDGDQDLAVANRNHFVSILKNNGDGIFGNPVDYVTAGLPFSVVAFDFDGDSDVDLCVANVESSFVSIFKNNGNGTFASKVDYPTGIAPYSVSASDLDGDGDIDLAVANRESNNVSILLNNGDGTFAPKTDYSTGDHPESVVGSDLDNDGDIDLITGNTGYGDNHISVFKNNGNGTFSAGVNFKVSFGCGASKSIAVSDIDGDGDQDLSVVSAFCDYVSILKNDGSANFTTDSRYIVGPGPTFVALSDFDGDAIPDLAVPCKRITTRNNSIAILRNKGDGTFVYRAEYSASAIPRSVFAADFNNDGYHDLATANYYFGGPDTLVADVSILKNKGDGTFLNWRSYRTAAGLIPYSGTASDLTGDGYPDIVLANGIGNSITVLKNKGDGTFLVSSNYSVGNTPISIASSDFDGDEDQDLVVADSGNNSVSLLNNNGDGTFASKVDYGTGNGPHSVFASDIDGDGDKDLIVANSGQDYSADSNVSILKNNGNGTFAPRIDYKTGLSPWSVFLADLDGDGDEDIAVANLGSNSVSILKNNGNGTFTTKADYRTQEKPSSVIAVDLDGDQSLDLIVTDTWNNTVSFLRNNGDGTFSPKVDYGVGESPTSVIAADLDGDGDRDLAIAHYFLGYPNVSVLINLSNTGCANKPGDLDHDCLLTVADIVPQLNCVFLNLGDCRLTLTDVNCSGAATPADVVLLLLTVFASQPLPCQ